MNKQSLNFILSNHTLDIPFGKHVTDIDECDYCKAAIVEAVEGLINDENPNQKHITEKGLELLLARNSVRAELRQAIKECQ